MRGTALRLRSSDSSATADSAASTVAYVGLLLIGAYSVLARPLCERLGLPSALVNLDSVALVGLTTAVVVLVLTHWKAHPAELRRLTVATLALYGSGALSWVTATDRNWATLGLAYSSVLILPLALYTAAIAARAQRSGLTLLTIRIILALQICWCVVQYVVHNVAATAPYSADLVDGTTGHTLWPVFALPLALVVILVGGGRNNAYWLAALGVMGVFAEAKAALMVWIVVAVVVAGGALLHAVGGWAVRRDVPRPSGSQLSTVAAAAALVTVIGVGLWSNNSVINTWAVYQGHSAELDQMITGGPAPQHIPPTLSQGLSRIDKDIFAAPARVLVGLGPGNSVSHASEVMARGTQSGVHLPQPSSRAVALVGTESELRFRDAQSSVVGIWGDLGLFGLLSYGASLLLTLQFFLRRILGRLSVRAAAAATTNAFTRAFTCIMLVVGVLTGGILLDWSEQASVSVLIGLGLIALTVPRASAERRQATAATTDGSARQQDHSREDHDDADDYAPREVLVEQHSAGERR